MRKLGEGEVGDLAHLGGGARQRRAEKLGLGLVLRGPTAEHEQDRRAEVRRDPRVVGELGGAPDVGVVTADHDDGVALGFDGLEALDDRPERRLRVAAHVVIRHADALVVVEVDPVVREQHLEDVVALHSGAGDRAEHADPGGRVAECVQHPQRNGRLARVALCRSDEDALRHAGKPTGLIRQSTACAPIAAMSRR